MSAIISQVHQAEIRAVLDSTQDAFTRLVASLSDDAWCSKAPGSNWTGKQLLHHVTWALEQLPRELESAKVGKGMFNYPGFIANPGSYWLVKWESRRESRDSVLVRYGAAMERVRAALDGVVDSDWEKGARFYGERFYTVTDLFHTPAEHLREHAAAFVAP